MQVSTRVDKMVQTGEQALGLRGGREIRPGVRSLWVVFPS